MNSVYTKYVQEEITIVILRFLQVGFYFGTRDATFSSLLQTLVNATARGLTPSVDPSAKYYVVCVVDCFAAATSAS